MNDAEYIFKQTASERKRNGYGDYHKKRQGGRQVRLPSDHLSKKELAALSSDVTKFNLNAPVCWAEFKNWPNDLKIEYLQKLEHRYFATTDIVAAMMGIGYKPLAQLKRDLGIPSKRGGKRPPLDVVGWAAFCGTPVVTAPDPEQILPASPLNCEETQAEEMPKCEEPEPEKIDNSTIMNLAILLDALKGSGAKLTIEVTL